LGSRRLALVRKLVPSPLCESYAESGAPCHHLIICALELRAAPVAAAVCAFAYQTLSGSAYAAMKLLRLGQERAQGIVRRVLSSLLADWSAGAPAPDRIGWFNPLLEIASLRHALASERLFIS
jgi:urease accessory protein